MAIDWLKLRVTLDREPQVLRMERFLLSQDVFIDWLRGSVMECHGSVTRRDESVTERVTQNVTRDAASQTARSPSASVALRRVTRDVVIGGLRRVWGALADFGYRENDDLVASPCCFDDVTDIAEVPLFADAMALADWLLIEDEGNAVRLPNYLKENSLGSEMRAAGGKPKSGAQRSREYRDRQRREAEEQASDEARDAKRDEARDEKSDASRNVTTRKEKKRKEKSTDKDDSVTGRDGVSDEFDTEFVTEWNSMASSCGLPEIESLGHRASSLRARMREAHWRDNWKAALWKIPESAFLTGSKDFKANVKWFLRKGSVRELIEGSYPPSRGPGKPTIGAHNQSLMDELFGTEDGCDSSSQAAIGNDSGSL